jgi:type II secretory pathway pseudopilin PulG
VSNLYIALGLSAIIALAVGGAFTAGVYYQKQSAELDRLEDYNEGTQDAQDATSGLPDDDSGTIKWLREYIGR